MAAAREEPKLVGALAAGLRLLRHLARSQSPAGVSQLARELRLNPSTCFNLLKTLVHEELVTFDPATKTYRIGLGLVAMARGALEPASYVKLVRPHLEAIAARHRVTATLWQRMGEDRVLLVDRADNDAAMRVHMNIGQRLPMYVAALGRCMAASSGLSQAALRKQFARLRWQDAPSFDTYWKQVEQARARGYAVDEGHFVRGVTTVSAAVVGPHGVPVMAVSAVGFSAQFKGAELRALCDDIRARTLALSQALAGSNEEAA
jgi:DNA-binding IclR family transcriptional regulator